MSDEGIRSLSRHRSDGPRQEIDIRGLSGRRRPALWRTQSSVLQLQSKNKILKKQQYPRPLSNARMLVYDAVPLLFSINVRHCRGAEVRRPAARVNAPNIHSPHEWIILAEWHRRRRIPYLTKVRSRRRRIVMVVENKGEGRLHRRSRRHR